jgi:hypothetical protein
LRNRLTLAAVVVGASMIGLPLHPSPASGTSAFNKIRAFSRRHARLLLFRISASWSERSPRLDRTTYFFAAISFAAIRLRRSGRAESYSSNPFNFVEAGY